MSFARCTLLVLLVALSGCTMGLAATLLDEETSVAPTAPADASADSEKSVRHAHAHAHAHEAGWLPPVDAATDADAEAEADADADAP